MRVGTEPASPTASQFCECPAPPAGSLAVDLLSPPLRFLPRKFYLMLGLLRRRSIAAGFSLFATVTASAHLTYTGRDFGVFTGTSAQSVTIANQVVTTASGWADGTDANFSHTHWVTAYRFTLQS